MKLQVIFQQVDVHLNESIKINELIKLANQSIQRRTRDRNGKDNNKSYFSKQKISWSFKRSKKCYVLIFKRRLMKEEKDIAPVQGILQNFLENQAVQRTGKFIEMKGIVILAKVREMYNIFKSLIVIVYWSRYKERTFK